MVIVPLIWRCRQQTTKDLTMKLELPDNNASVLFHMGNALQSIARDIDTSLPVNGHKITHTETVGDVSHSVTVEPLMVMATGDKNPINTDASERRYLDESELSDTVDDIDKPVVWDTSGHWEEKSSELANAIDTLNQASDTIDADGLPWDQRIHSKGKTRIAGNVWRSKKKPPEKTDEEWSEYVETVKTELRALMDIPVITAEQRAELKVHVDYAEDPNEVDPFATEPPTLDAVDVNGVEFRQLPGVVHSVEINCAVVTPPVVEAVVTPPVVEAVVTPPVVEAVVTPPVVEAVVTPPVVTGPTTFPELMKFITVNNKKLTKESVDEALKAQGLASIALLAARTDLIPQVHAALVELL
jgi:hypothetical protein